MEGWIKIYRKLCQWEWYNISEMVHLFIHLLLNANREPGEWRGVKIERGQILTGLNSLHKETNISFQTLRTCLKRLEKTKEINIQVTNKYSIITICNFESYQNGQQATNKQPNKQLTSNQQTTNKQLTTNKKEENIKNEDNEEKSEVEKAWLKWKEYKKKEYRFNYKSEVSEESAKKQLIELSGNNAEIAIKIIEQSISNGWKGFFKLKNNKNGIIGKPIGATDEELAIFFANKYGVDAIK